MSLLSLVSFLYFCIKKKCRKSKDMPARDRDMFRPVTLQLQENFKVETGRIWLQFITEDKFTPLSHNLWPVSSISSHWLRNILMLFICHAVTLSKMFSFLSFLSSVFPLVLATYIFSKHGSYPNFVLIYRKISNIFPGICCVDAKEGDCQGCCNN